MNRGRSVSPDGPLQRWDGVSRSPRAVSRPTEEMTFELLMIPEPEVRLGIHRYLQATKDPRKVIADTRAVYFGTVLK